jgi:hypothetical protein
MRTTLGSRHASALTGSDFDPEGSRLPPCENGIVCHSLDDDSTLTGVHPVADAVDQAQEVHAALPEPVVLDEGQQVFANSRSTAEELRLNLLRDWVPGQSYIASPVIARKYIRAQIRGTK